MIKTDIARLILAADKVGLTDPDVAWLIPVWLWKAALLASLI